MTDLATAIREYYDSAAAPITCDEIRERRASLAPESPSPQMRRRRLSVTLAAAVGTLIIVGGLIIATVGLRFHPEAPGATAEQYQFSGVQWLGFEFAYPGEGTDLEHTDSVTLVEGPGPYPEHTLLLFEGADHDGFSDVVWVSYQTGRGSIVRDALVVTHPRVEPDVRLGCATRPDEGAHPAVALTSPDGSTVLSAWYVDVSVLRIERIAPPLVVCPPRDGEP